MLTPEQCDAVEQTLARQRELLIKVWTALRGVSVEVPPDADYAGELAEDLDSEYLLT